MYIILASYFSVGKLLISVSQKFISQGFAFGYQHIRETVEDMGELETVRTIKMLM